MKVLGARVDALELAYRVKLDESFVAALRARAEVARTHGRAAFEWTVRAPDDDGDGTVDGMRRMCRNKTIPGLRLRWADEADRVQMVSRVWGELHFSKAAKVWQIVNEPFFRLRVELCAPGGGELRDCPACKGTCFIGRHELCSVCDGKGTDEEPGWTVSVKWYAQTLADWGLDWTLRESAALASMCGEVLETRLRRVDLCADVEGWEIRAHDVRRLAKRPRAKWGVYDDGTIGHVDDRTGKVSGKPTDEGVNVYGTGRLAKRRITGLTVGRGGAMQARIYDKRAELDTDTRGDRKLLEEERWREAGWDGVSPVGRVEFQIRGVALVEFGLRDPDACLEPVFRREAYVDARGKRRSRDVVAGHRVLVATNDNGEEVQATLVHRLEDIWSTCLDWVSLVVPEKTKGGADKAVSRLRDDPRWTLLRGVTFAAARVARPIRRYRVRNAASSAQALGVALSQAGRDGRLRELDERKSTYKDDPRSAALLRARILSLKVQEAERIVGWLLEKYGGAAGANEHLAVRSNAARMRFLRGLDAAFVEQRAGPDPPLQRVA